MIFTLGSVRNPRDVVSGKAVPEYHIYGLDEHDCIVSRWDVRVRDDLAALDEGRKLCGRYAVEIWDGTRLVARLTKDGAAGILPDSQADLG